MWAVTVTAPLRERTVVNASANPLEQSLCALADHLSVNVVLSTPNTPVSLRCAPGGTVSNIRRTTSNAPYCNDLDYRADKTAE